MYGERQCIWLRRITNLTGKLFRLARPSIFEQKTSRFPPHSFNSFYIDASHYHSRRYDLAPHDASVRTGVIDVLSRKLCDRLTREAAPIRVMIEVVGLKGDLRYVSRHGLGWLCRNRNRRVCFIRFLWLQATQHGKQALNNLCVAVSG